MIQYLIFFALAFFGTSSDFGTAERVFGTRGGPICTVLHHDMGECSVYRRNNAGDEIEAFENGHPQYGYRLRNNLEVEAFMRGYEFVDANEVLSGLAEAAREPQEPEAESEADLCADAHEVPSDLDEASQIFGTRRGRIFTMLDHGMNHYSFFRRNNTGDEIEALENGVPITNTTRGQVRLVEDFIEGYEFVDPQEPQEPEADLCADTYEVPSDLDEAARIFGTRRGHIFTMLDHGMNHFSFFRRNNTGDEIEALENGVPITNTTRWQVRLVEDFIEGYEFIRDTQA